MTLRILLVAILSACSSNQPAPEVSAPADLYADEQPAAGYFSAVLSGTHTFDEISADAERACAPYQAVHEGNIKGRDAELARFRCE